MFTGIIQAQAPVASLDKDAQGARLSLENPMAWDLKAGESVAVNGCCLTVLPGGRLSFDLSLETLAKTALGALRPGSFVNLERALCAGDALGGHLVSGHVDGLAVLAGVEEQGEGSLWRLRVPKDLARLIADKGSVSLDGVSLTPFDVRGTEFSVALIPHTLQVTTLGRRKAGDSLHLEIDLVARYLARLLETRDL